MNATINILHLEDLLPDVTEVKAMLHSSELSFDYLSVPDHSGFESALKEFEPDLILGDITLPTISIMQALEMVHETGRRIPFIIVTGPASERVAVKLMAVGIEDYILKDRLQRLPVAITNTLKKVESEKKTKKHYAQMFNSAQRSRAMIENISDAIILLDKDGGITYHSPSVKRISGYTFLETGGKTIFDFIHPGEVAQFREFFNTVCAIPGVSMPTVFSMKHKNGSYASTEGSITNFLYEESTRALIINCRDITTRKEDEQLLRKSEANLRAIFDNTDISYVFVNRETCIVSFNHQAVVIYKRALGVDIKEGDNILDYAESENKDISKTRFGAVLEGFKISYEAKFNIDGGTAWFAVNMLPVRDTADNVLGFILSSEDITRRKVVELEKVSMTSEILSHNKDLEQFTYIVSHNLRAPVASIMALTGLLRQAKDTKPGDFDKYLDGLSLSAAKLDELIIDLNFIMQTRKGVNENKEKLSFTNIINDMRIIISDIADKHITIKTDFLIDEVFTVKSYMHSIFINLITNSIKYRKPDADAEILISTLKADGKLILKFSDNGLGIDMNLFGDKLFGLYKRFHTHVDGKGMGLYLVKTQLEMLGGKISVSSAVNKGTEFIITFVI